MASMMRIRQAVTWRIGLGLLVMTGAATAELPPPIPNDPSFSEESCRAELKNMGLAPQDQNDLYRCKLDFARLENAHPLPHDRLIKITPDDLMDRETTQERLDQIYARLTAGPIPEGRYKIRIFRARADGLQGSVRFEDFTPLAGAKGKGLDLLLANGQMLRRLFPLVWRAKVFEKDKSIARTQLFTTLPSFFPGKVYCGQSLLDGRRESIILDYAFSHDIPGYRKMIDKWTGPTGLQIRDEFRRVRPGLYLGRVYMGRIFVFNFVLYNPDLLNKPQPESAWKQEDCDVGLQRQVVRR